MKTYQLFNGGEVFTFWGYIWRIIEMIAVGVFLLSVFASILALAYIYLTYYIFNDV